MGDINEIRDFMKESKYFQEQPDTNGRRFYFIQNGERVAYIWFKWALNGWNLIVGKQKERNHLDSLDKLKTLLSI